MWVLLYTEDWTLNADGLHGYEGCLNPLSISSDAFLGNRDAEEPQTSGVDPCSDSMGSDFERIDNAPSPPVHNSAPRPAPGMKRRFTGGLFLSDWRPPEPESPKGCGLLVWDEDGIADLLWVRSRGEASRIKAMQTQLPILSVQVSPSQEYLTVFSTETLPGPRMVTQNISLITQPAPQDTNDTPLEDQDPGQSARQDTHAGGSNFTSLDATFGDSEAAASTAEACGTSGQLDRCTGISHPDLVSACMVARRGSSSPFTIFKVPPLIAYSPSLLQQLQAEIPQCCCPPLLSCYMAQGHALLHMEVNFFLGARQEVESYADRDMDPA